MTTLRQDAIKMLEGMPEDKIVFILQIMRGINGLYGKSDISEKEKAFQTLEGLKRKVEGLDTRKEIREV